MLDCITAIPKEPSYMPAYAISAEDYKDIKRIRIGRNGLVRDIQLMRDIPMLWLGRMQTILPTKDDDYIEMNSSWTMLHYNTDPFSYTNIVCSGNVVVTAYDFESGRPGSNPEWGLIYYLASITAQGLPEPSSLRDNTLGIPEQLNMKAVAGACKLIDCPELCSFRVSVVSAGICHRNEVNPIAWLYRRAQSKR